MLTPFHIWLFLQIMMNYRHTHTDFLTKILFLISPRLNWHTHNKVTDHRMNYGWFFHWRVFSKSQPQPHGGPRKRITIVSAVWTILTWVPLRSTKRKYIISKTCAGVEFSLHVNVMWNPQTRTKMWGHQMPDFNWQR